MASIVTDTVPRDLVIIPDLHIPWHHQRAVSAMLEFCYDKKPGMAVQLGDAYDMYSVSSYRKKPDRMRKFGGTVVEEAEAGKGLWLNLLESCDEVWFIEGNHEDRITRNIVDENPGLAGHPSLESKAILQLPERVRVVPAGIKLRVGNITICHGHELGLTRSQERGANPAQAVLKKYPYENIVFGHSHKISTAGQVIYKYDRPRTFGVWNVGWLGDASQIDYEFDPLSRLGFAYVEFWKDADGRQRFTFYQIEMVDGRFSWGGKVYGA